MKRDIKIGIIVGTLIIIIVLAVGVKIQKNVFMEFNNTCNEKYGKNNWTVYSETQVISQVQICKKNYSGAEVTR